ncbi:hypothetical protein BDP55DRAFT_637139 [Colletotrichum godetiae]|uniref:Uncharacterized protein n=1 Tax=Colletotrichum godetiae TaxID=1209918 RepID=A0AAJ0EN04_9PEZI|nr:uncharacterized protein BDP55DRAFT_637139 [Colletotrichum godetiae]KAK1659265.1 hypothetical protein BDP55DRAFT_637139 [Colletotrichum godetiae]
MAGFGDTIDSLLETYSKCLSLLKGLKGARNSRQPRQLRRSLRSDRSKVQSVYSSKLSVAGTHLEKGDAVARSSVRRVIKRLTSATANLLHLMTRGQNPVIDYQSLKTLSNSSRVDAVKAINDLSQRLSTSSEVSLVRVKQEEQASEEDTCCRQQAQVEGQGSLGAQTPQSYSGRCSTGDETSRTCLYAAIEDRETHVHGDDVIREHQAGRDSAQQVATKAVGKAGADRPVQCCANISVETLPSTGSQTQETMGVVRMTIVLVNGVCSVSWEQWDEVCMRHNV